MSRRATKVHQKWYFVIVNIKTEKVYITHEKSEVAGLVGVHRNTVHNHINDTVWEVGDYKVYFKTEMLRVNQGGNRK